MTNVISHLRELLAATDSRFSHARTQGEGGGGG